jgi:hypothetical protein
MNFGYSGTVSAEDGFGSQITGLLLPVDPLGPDLGGDQLEAQ